MTRIVIAVLATLAFLTAAYFWHEHKVSVAFEQGRAVERLEWKEAQAAAAKLVRDKETALRKAELERQSAEREAKAANQKLTDMIEEAAAYVEPTEPTPDVESAPCRCPPAINRRLRDIIQNVR